MRPAHFSPFIHLTISLFILIVTASTHAGGINVGGPAFTQGEQQFSQDGFFLAGRSSRSIALAPDDQRSLPQEAITGRAGEVTYNIPVENGVYDLSLAFAELESLQAGQRVFQVIVEEELLLDDFDIAQQSGANQSLKIPLTATVLDGFLTIQTSALVGQPLLNAIEWDAVNILPRIDAGRDRVFDTATLSEARLTGVIDEALSDADYEIVWSQAAGPVNAAIDDINSLETAIGITEPGLYTFELKLEAFDLAISDSVSILVSNGQITTDQGRGADAQVQLGGGSNNNYGGQSRLGLRNPNAGFTQKAYFRFDTDLISQSVTGAALSLNVVGIPGNSGIIKDYVFRVYALEEALDYGYRRVGEFWTEGSGSDEGDQETFDANSSTISWLQAPGNNAFGGSTVDERYTTLLGTFRSFDNRQRVEHLANQALVDFLKRDSNGVVTLIVTRENVTNNPSFIASKELAKSSGFAAPTLHLATNASTNVAPSARLSADGLRGDLGVEVDFDASASFDEDGQIVEYIWDMGDDKTLITTTEPALSYVFNRAGIFPVGLTVVDNQGARSPANRLSITVDAVWGEDVRDVRFPVDAEVLDVTKAPFFAKGDGISDDTQAIQKALDFFGSQRNAIIYLPNGEYLVSDTLFWPATINPDGTRAFGSQGQNELTILQGQSRNAVIRLQDNARGFDELEFGKAVVNMGPSAAMNFRNSIRSLTINTGDFNPGAIGLTYTSSNQGTAYDLLIEAGDGDGDGVKGDGLIGLDLRNNQNGPHLIKKVEVRGFNDGITNFDTQNSQTFENIRLIDQKVRGFYNRRQAVFINGLYAENRFGRPAIQNFRDGGSFITLINAELKNTAASRQGNAIGYIDFSNGATNRTHAFLRNITVENYDTAINVLAGFKDPFPPNEQGVAFVDEFVSDPSNNNEVVRLWPNLERSLDLEIKDAPEVPWGASSSWVNVLDFLSSEDRFKARDVDLSNAVQAALNSGATTIYLPRAGNPDGFFMNQDVKVPSNVRRIIGLETRLNGEGRFILEEQGEPIIFERLFPIAGGIHHESDRTVIVKNSQLHYTSASEGAGDFYGEDFLGSLQFNKQNAWLRQFNSECVSPRMQNNAGKVWILGIKTECFGPVIETYEGGSTEVLGTFFYTSGTPGAGDGEPFADKSLAAFITVDSNLSVAGHREQNFVETQYQTIISETRKEETRTVSGSTNDGVVASSFMLYTAFTVDEEQNTAPSVSAGDDQYLNIVSASGPISSRLIGAANDDGFPQQGTEFTTEWEQTSGPAKANIISPNQLETEVQLPVSGIYTFTLSAEEGSTPNSLVSQDEVSLYLYDDEITTAEGQGADGDVGGSNSAASASLVIRRNNFQRKAYLRFDVSTLDLDNIDAAALSLTMTGNSVFVSDSTVNIFGLIENESYGEGILDELWSENALVYANAPGNFTVGTGGVYDPNIENSAGVRSEFTQFLGSVQTQQRINETLTLNSDALTEFLRADTNGVVTLILTREEFISDSGRVVRIATKEADELLAPSLQVLYNDTRDGDNDGLPDKWEQINFLNPNDPFDALLDLDGDSLSNLVEFELGTNIYLLDSDGDGASDSFEFASGTDPLSLVSMAQIQRGQFTVSQPSNDREKWHAVFFPQAFSQIPVVVMGPPSFNGGDPLTVAVRNISETGFEFQLDEWDYLNQAHIEESIAWLALPTGSYTLHGLKVSAELGLPVDNRLQEVRFAEPFNSAPVIFAQRTSYQEPYAAAVRLRNVTEERFDIQLQQQESNQIASGEPQLEQVSYIAVEPGSSNRLAFDVIRAEDDFTHRFKSLASVNATASDLLLAAVQTRNGGDPIALRYRWSPEEGLQVKLEEERSNDLEVKHIGESLAYWIFYDDL